MSWLYSQALVAEYLGGTSLDGEQSAPLSAMLTPQQFWRNDKMMDCSKPSLFGLTLQHLTADRGEELLKSFRAAFHVRTFPAQEKAQDLTESAADCGQSLPGLLAKYDPDTHSLRTAQCSLFGDLTECYVTLPRWGLMRDGALYLPPTVALPMREKGCGLWPTPRACDYKGVSSPEAAEKVLERGFSHNLPERVAYLKKWPTPTAHNAKETNAPSESERNTPTLAAQAGGALNPMWVEWLMGWPIGWTDLRPLETDRFQQWQQQHSEFYQGSEDSL
jgi:hypothetical protein